jgi:catechol 2,3-dioxygenase
MSRRKESIMTHTAHPDTRIGHVHLKVADLDRAIAFYTDVMGFEVTQRYGAQAAFLSAGGYHHHIGLNTWQSRGGPPPGPGMTGLYHVAFLYPDRPALARTLASVIAAGSSRRRRGRSRRLRGGLFPRSGWERYRDLPRQARNRLAPGQHRRAADGQRTP